jgi:hypothetical protein
MGVRQESKHELTRALCDRYWQHLGRSGADSSTRFVKLWGFDPHMRSWGVEDLDLSLKCWLMGCRILYDPQALIGHRFRTSFDTYAVPIKHVILNQVRTVRKHFTYGMGSLVGRRPAAHPGAIDGASRGVMGVRVAAI